MMKNENLDKMKKKAAILRKVALIVDKMRDNEDRFLFLPAFIIMFIGLCVMAGNVMSANNVFTFIFIPLVSFVIAYWGFMFIAGKYTKKWFKEYNQFYTSYTIQKRKEEKRRKREELGLY